MLKVRPKEFIHLNLVSDVDEVEESNIKCECLLLQLHGDVVAIKNKRKPIQMEDIGRSEGQSVPQRILVEGCPGIGKTMFSWELCRQWAEGKMLQDRDIVVMLQLRSKRAQEANRLSDLFYHDNDRVRQEVVDYITSVEGRGVFLVLEGYDELVEDQKSEGSILHELLAGDCLPNATIMVTSRPVASGSLCIEFKERVDQHIEVVGFNDEDIKSYVESACQKEPQILPDLISYMSSNPFVYSVMYIPLQCAIITALYVEKWKKTKGNIYAPTTLTQLYTDLLLSSLIRYIGDQPAYSKLKSPMLKLSDLPSTLQEQVWQLSQLAAEGLENKKFIFDSIPCDHMGLMQSTEEELVIGSSVSYCFLHLTLQEYLAALHWSRMESEDVVELVSKTSLFPLNTLARDGINKSGYHWPALYFLSGLTKLTFIPMHLLKLCLSAAFGEVDEVFASHNLPYYSIQMGTGKPLEFLKPVVNEVVGTKCNPYFFQLLFESQSHDLVNSLFTGELVRPIIANPLECFVTSWCVANSNPTSQWTLDIRDNLLEDFIKYAEKLGCSSVEHQHGLIIGLKIDPGDKNLTYSDPPKSLASLPSLLPCLEYLLIVSPMDMAPLLSNLHKLIALNFIAIRCNLAEDITFLPLQHCPSLSTVILYGSQMASYIFASIVFPNIITIKCIKSHVTRSDLNKLCSILCDVTCCLQELELMDVELSTDDAQKLAQALKMNRSLTKFSFDLGSRITSDGRIILLESLRKHPTIVYNHLHGHYMYMSTSSDDSDNSDDDHDVSNFFAYPNELKRQMVHSFHPLSHSIYESKTTSSDHPSALARQSEEKQWSTEGCAIANTASEDEDLELALALSQSLEIEEKRRSGEEKEGLGHSMVSIGNEGEDLQESMSQSVALEEEQRSGEKNPQGVCHMNTRRTSNTACEDEDLELALALSQSLETEEKRRSGEEKKGLGFSMAVSTGNEGEDLQESTNPSVALEEEQRSGEKNPQGVCHMNTRRTSNTACEDEDLELALALSQSLEAREMKELRREGRTIGHSMVNIGNEGEDLQESTNLSVALEEEQRSGERNPQGVCHMNIIRTSNTACEDEDLELALALSQSLEAREMKELRREGRTIGHSMVNIGNEGEDLQESMSSSLALEEEQRNPQCVCHNNIKNASNTASEDEDLEESPDLKLKSCSQ